MNQRMFIYLWFLVMLVIVSLGVGVLIGQKRYKSLPNQLKKIEGQLRDCEKRIEQSNHATQEDSIINPE